MKSREEGAANIGAIDIESQIVIANSMSAPIALLFDFHQKGEQTKIVIQTDEVFRVPL